MNRDQKASAISVLFVCMGNICRSPTAQGAMEKRLEEASLTSHVRVDSAGTHAYHAGEAPDRRSTAAAERVGIDLSEQRARAICADDFVTFDYIVAMDKDNMFHLSKACPDSELHRLSLLMDYAPGTEKYVPDPYYGGAQGFEQVLQMCLEATQGLVERIKKDRVL